MFKPSILPANKIRGGYFLRPVFDMGGRGLAENFAPGDGLGGRAVGSCRDDRQRWAVRLRGLTASILPFVAPNLSQRVANALKSLRFTARCGLTRSQARAVSLAGIEPAAHKAGGGVPLSPRPRAPYAGRACEPHDFGIFNPNVDKPACPLPLIASYVWPNGAKLSNAGSGSGVRVAKAHKLFASIGDRAASGSVLDRVCHVAGTFVESEGA